MTASDALDNPSYFDVGAAASADQAGRPTPEPPPPPPPAAPAAAAAPAPPTKPLLPLLKRRQRGAMTTVAGQRAVSQGAATTRRLGFRWLLRSMSGSSTSLQQIALGQPRPGDVAPPSPTSDALAAMDGPLASPGPVVSPGRLREHREHREHAAGTAGTMPRAAPGYYNVEAAASATAHRRHSVGSVMHSARPRTAASHGLSSTAAPSTASATSSTLADDIVMVWSGGGGTSAASLWITYLQSCFVEICRKRGRPSFRTSDVSVDELAGEGAVAERWRTRLELAKLVVLVVCPVMLARLSSSLAALAGPMARLDSDRALIMLLGVHEYELQPEHRAVLGGDCRRMAVRDQDASFVGEFLAVAMDILVRAWRARAAKERRSADGGALFSLAPKKVKQGMNKVLALLVSPLQPGDDVHVAVHKGAPSEAVALPSRSRNPYTLQFSIPEDMLDVSAMVSVTVSVNGQPLGTRQLKCESRLRELDRILRARDNPLQYLCQTLGFGPSDRDALDNSLLCSYLRNVPPHFNLLQDPGPASRAAPSYSCEQYPTLLHFAAHFGLERLAMALLEGPGGEQACYVRNCNDLTPAELGERAGYSRLACALQGYMQMSELSNVYTILQNMTDADGGGTAFSNDESGSYLSPRPASETYSVPPPPLPAPQGIAPPPFPAPTAGHAGTPAPDPYVDMKELTSLYQNMPRRSQSSSPTAEAPDDAYLCPDAVYQDIDENHDAAGAPPSECCSVGADVPDGVLRPRPGWTREGSAPVDEHRAQRRPRRGSDPLAGREEPVDDDLMDVIRDLKSSSFSLGEVEHLVHSWRGRNATHQSFRDKQEQLARMREELQQVEHRLGGQGQGQTQGAAAAARPSPLERIKRVFTKARHGRHAASKDKGTRSDHRGDSAPPGAGSGTALTGSQAPTRPPSSLSRRSSSSSTWSGRSSDAAEPAHPVQVDEVSWLHPVSPASADSHYVHYVSPMGIRPVAAALSSTSSTSSTGTPTPTPVCSGGSRGGVDRVDRADRLDLDLAEDGFPLDPSGFSSYVNVHLPSWPPPVPAKAGLKDTLQDLPEDAV